MRPTAGRSARPHSDRRHRAATTGAARVSKRRPTNPARPSARSRPGSRQPADLTGYPANCNGTALSSRSRTTAYDATRGAGAVTVRISCRHPLPAVANRTGMTRHAALRPDRTAATSATDRQAVLVGHDCANIGADCGGLEAARGFSWAVFSSGHAAPPTGCSSASRSSVRTLSSRGPTRTALSRPEAM